MTSCLLCGHSARFETVSAALRDDSSGRHSVVRCPACGHVQLTPLPSPEWETAFHAEDRQARLVFQRDDFVPTLLEKKKTDLDRRVAWLRDRLPGGGRIIEVASGYGVFVDGFAKAGYEAHGIEHSPFRLAVARQGMQGHFHEGVVEDAFLDTHAGRFDVVFAFHRLLHARNPHDYVRRLTALCRPGGVVHLEEPNLDDDLMAQIPDYAGHRWQVSHYHYFTPATLGRLLAPYRHTISGLQRYGVRHLLQWSDHHRPDLSGVEPPPSIPALARLEQLYRQDRERRMTCDSMIAVVEAG